MDLPTSVSSFTSGSAIQDTVTPGLATVTSQTSGMSGLSSIPGMSTALATIQSMTAAATAAWQSTLSQLSVALPAMKAVHVLESKLSMANGGMAPTQGSASFTSYFGAIDNVKSQITSLSSSVTSSISTMGSQATAIPGVTGSGPAALTSLAAAIPVQMIPNPSSPGTMMTNPAYTSFMSTNSTAISGLTSSAGSLGTLASTANTNVTAQFTAASNAYTSGVVTLKSMAFASFCSQAHPAPVAAAIAKTVNPSNIPSQSQLTVAAQSTSTWLQAQGATSKIAPASTIVSTPDNAVATPAPSPTTFTPTACTSTQLSNIDAVVDTWYNMLTTDAAAIDSGNASLTAWMTSVNYAAIKNNQANDPTTYANLKAQALSRPETIALFTAQFKYNLDKVTWRSLQQIQGHMSMYGTWPGNPNGPWDTAALAHNSANATAAAQPGATLTALAITQADATKTPS